ncbi:MAG: branched-chain amino acid ABC transporter permease [Deltaproteobacteria bacterium HGW-Deltaproteobacteria-19]|jgi:branched-chain amino acid transport system permease protein|nr:MAG: branched-chain amino acid ABC transporter permease [Deltaproteobacteria bacterium HGW-Deltaproteobacteria-19]
MKRLAELRESLVIALWFMFLTFPILVIQVNTIEKTIIWRWQNLLYVGIGSFALSFVWRYFIGKAAAGGRASGERAEEKTSILQRITADSRFSRSAILLTALIALAFPFLSSTYQVNIMTTALMYVVLGLGLNIVVGQAGLLHLGYVAFYAVGAYTYALLYQHFGIGFWTALPLGALMAMVFGLLLGFPVLRLRGDYLAIVTLGFGEITRIVLENWSEFSSGPSGISEIPRPGFFNLAMDLEESTIYLYFLMVGFVLFTIFVTNRLQNSRIGRAWLALREDEVACEAMGVNKTVAKMTAFALGSTWAGMMGVVFAAKTTFVNPASFTFLESAMILSIVVLGGMGSTLGVILASFLLILLPEYLRAFSDYRMLLFGTIMVVMMIFRPQGIITNIRRTYEYHFERKQNGAPDASV